MSHPFPVGGIRFRDRRVHLAGAAAGVSIPEGIPRQGGPWAEAEFLGLLEYQDHAGACASFGPLDTLETLTLQYQDAHANLSEMDLYYGGRKLDGLHRQDNGMFLDSAFRWIAEHGVVSAASWPFNPDRVTNESPPPEADAERPHNRARFVEVTSVHALLSHLAGAGEDGVQRCVSFIHPVANHFFTETGEDGWVRPVVDSPISLPWHAQAFGAYDLDLQVPGWPNPGAVLARNHWRGWGIAHPWHPDVHPEGYSWWPLDLIADTRLIPQMIAPLEPIPVTG